MDVRCRLAYALFYSDDDHKEELNIEKVKRNTVFDKSILLNKLVCLSQIP